MSHDRDEKLFDAHGVSFVSVTQSFNTSSSMGRLTLNVLLSFAQFERELIGERVRDKIAASKRKGIWVGGPVPVGYAAVDKKILVVAAEAAAVRTIFARYLELGSVRALVQDLDRRGIRSKPRRLSNGRTICGVDATCPLLLQTPLKLYGIYGHVVLPLTFDFEGGARSGSSPIASAQYISASFRHWRLCRGDFATAARRANFFALAR
jgi:hypothetical protein